MSPLLETGIDIGDLEDASFDSIDRIVVVVPHPDDEALATGLLLARAANLHLPVTIIAVTDGDAAYSTGDREELAARRRREHHSALAELGIAPDRVDRIGIPDGDVQQHTDQLVAVIDRHLCDHGRSILLVAPSIHDWHPDHQASGHAAHLALRRRRTPGSVTFWSSLFWAHHHPDALIASRPRLIILTGTRDELAARDRAITSHRSQFEPPDGEQPVLTSTLIAHLDHGTELFVREQP